jgi:hypothetical protein
MHSLFDLYIPGKTFKIMSENFIQANYFCGWRMSVYFAEAPGKDVSLHKS